MWKVRDILTTAVILAGSVFVIWALMIRPYQGDWGDGGEVTARVKTLMSNSNVIGGAYINAVVILETGAQTIVQVPLKSNIRADSVVVLSVHVDTEKPHRKRYSFEPLR